MKHMIRHRNTDGSGKPFDPATIDAVWEKAEMSPEHAPLKKDPFGALIWRAGYGNTTSKLGWEIDHIQPVEQGGSDLLENLQALQWENHRRKDELMRTLACKPEMESEPETSRIASRATGIRAEQRAAGSI